MYLSRNFVWLTSFLLLLLTTPALGAVFHDANLNSVSVVEASLDVAGSLGAHGVLVLSEGEPVLRVRIDGGQPDQRLAATFHIYDHDGEERMLRTVSSGVDGQEDQVLLSLSELGPGWFRVLYRVHEADGLSDLARGSRDIVILAGRTQQPHRVGDSPFGIVNQRLQPHEANMAMHMGAGWIYEAATPTWAEVQFQPGGSLIWRARSESMAAAEDAGLLAAGNVGTAPAWADIEGLAQDPYLTDFYRFLRSYNQENLKGAVVATTPLFDSVLDEGGMAEFVRRIKLTSAALREATVAGRQLIELEHLSPQQMQQLARHGAVGDVDVVLVHLPVQNSIPEHYDWTELRRLRGLLRSFGSGAELWTVTPNAPNTETAPTSLLAGPAAISLFGTPTPSETAMKTAEGSYDSPLQAQWLVRSHVLQLAHGVDRIFSEPFSTGPSELRLFTGGAGAFPDMPQRPRPAMAAYATMAEFLAGAIYMGQLSMPTDIWAFLFSKQGEPVLVVWTTRTSATLELNNVNVPSVQVTDMMGAERQVHVASGRLILPISPSPHYVHGLDIGTVAQVLIDQSAERLDVLRGADDPTLPVRLEDLSQAVYAMAADLWLQAQVTGADLQHLVPTWYETVDKLLQFAYSLPSGGQQAQGALYEVLDLLAVMAELGAMMGVVSDPQEQEAQIHGTDALIADAREALQTRWDSDGAVTPTAGRLLDKVQRWWEQSADAADTARVAWAVIARESAALAMMHSAVEDPVLSNLFLLVEKTELGRPFPGFRPYEPFVAAQPLWEHIEQLIVGWVSPSDAVLQVSKGQKGAGHAVEPGTLEANGTVTHAPTGWDEIPLNSVAVNTVGRSALSSLVLDGPDDWFWRLGAQVLRVGENMSVELAGKEGQGVATDLDLGLLIPYGTPPGVYQVELTLHHEEFMADRVTLIVNVEEAPTTPPEGEVAAQ